MRTCEGVFTIDTGNYVDRFVLINEGGNHCQIRNNTCVLFDGYILEGYKVFEEKANAQKDLAQFAGWKYTRVK